MKVIELLNKIANGEDVPKKIRYDSDTYYYIEDNREGVCYINTALDEENIWRHFLYNISTLNDEVEVIGEQKEETKTTARESIEALGYACGEIQKCFTNGWVKSFKNKSLNKEDKKIEKIGVIKYSETPTEAILHKKIDEIIDYIMEDK